MADAQIVGDGDPAEAEVVAQQVGGDALDSDAGVTKSSPRRAPWPISTTWDAGVQGRLERDEVAIASSSHGEPHLAGAVLGGLRRGPRPGKCLTGEDIFAPS